MAESWGQPEKKIVAACAPVMDGDKQARDKYIQSALKYNIRFDGISSPTWVFATTEPQPGEEIEVILLTSTNAEGKTFTSYWTAAAKELKSKPRGGFPGGGAKSNYSLEQEAYRDSRRDAIAAISGRLVGKDGHPLAMTSENIARVTAKFMADLLAAGKKPE